MPGGEWTSDSSCDSDGAEKDPFAHPPTSDFVIPSPETLSDAEEDDSPSQYRKEMVLKESHARHDDEEEEDEDCEEEEAEEEEEDAHPVKENSVERMYTDVINIARQLTTTLEDTRKKELMSRKKTARQSLDFESPPPKPAKYRHERVTPPRHARDQIGTRQFEEDDLYERDSVGSSQTGSTRVRLQERWRVIGIKEKATTTHDQFNEWMQEHGRAEMAKAGLHEDLNPVATDVGGFKLVNVSYFNLFHVDKSDLECFFAGIQCNHRSEERFCQANSVELSLSVSMQMLCCSVGKGVPRQVCFHASR
jgi:hypothetical protein